MLGAMERRMCIAMLALVAGGCMNQSSIQGKYVAQQDACRQLVAQASAASKQVPSSIEGQAAIGTQFSECMNKAGWRVAMPKGNAPPTNVAQYPPSGAPSTNPSAAAAVAH